MFDMGEEYISNEWDAQKRGRRTRKKKQLAWNGKVKKGKGEIGKSSVVPEVSNK